METSLHQPICNIFSLNTFPCCRGLQTYGRSTSVVRKWSKYQRGLNCLLAFRHIQSFRVPLPVPSITALPSQLNTQRLFSLLSESADITIMNSALLKIKASMLWCDKTKFWNPVQFRDWPGSTLPKKTMKAFKRERMHLMLISCCIIKRWRKFKSKIIDNAQVTGFWKRIGERARIYVHIKQKSLVDVEASSWLMESIWFNHQTFPF